MRTVIFGLVFMFAIGGGPGGLRSATAARGLVRRRAAAIHPLQRTARLRAASSPSPSARICGSGSSRAASAAYDREILAYINSQRQRRSQAQMERIIAEYAAAVPHLKLSTTSSAAAADLIIHLINEKDFAKALEAGVRPAAPREPLCASTDPQCMTSVKSQPDGDDRQHGHLRDRRPGRRRLPRLRLSRAAARFRPVEPRPEQSLDHAQPDPRGSATSRSMTASLLTLLYEPRIEPGMTAAEVRRILPELIRALPPNK